MVFHQIKKLFATKEKLPSNYFIDPSNICNLSCPLCPTGLKLTENQKLMSFKLYKKVVDQMPKNKFIGLYNWGEPFLNPDIFKMIRYAKMFSHYIEIHSNFNLSVDSKFCKKLFDSELDKLVLSIDGASQKTYSKYRRGGNYNLVIKNLTTLVDYRKLSKKTGPEIVWKFMVNRFNEHQVTIARQKASKLNINFMTSSIGLSDDLPDRKMLMSISQRKKYWLPKNIKFIRPHYIGKYSLLLHNQKCHFLFDSIFIDPSGKVFPCCELSDEKYSFGDLTKKSLVDIWNNDTYRFSRSFFKKNKTKKVRTICNQCGNYLKSS